MVYVQPAWQLATWRAPGSLPDDDVDVVVMGGGLSGCAAAVAAARQGVRTVLVEGGHLLGGQMSASGVGASDIWSGTMPIVDNGLWGEFVRRTNTVYRTEMAGKATNTNGYSPQSFAASATVVDRVWSEMLFEAGVEVVRSCPATSVRLVSTGAAVSSSEGATLRCRVVVEATEDGSVLAQTGVRHRIGNQISGATTPVRTPYPLIQAITFPAVIRRYPGGVPEEVRMVTPPSAYQEFREGIAKWYPRAPWTPAGDTKGFAGFRGMPDLATDTSYTAVDYDSISRTSLNYLNDVQVSAEYLVNPAYRLAKDRLAIQVTMSIVYYLQAELGLPWGLCTDEGFADGPPSDARARLVEGLPAMTRHLPSMAYVRESRRLLGPMTMTLGSVGRTRDRDAPWVASAVAVATYPFDLHGSASPQDMELDLGETSFPTERPGAFPVPMEALVPADDSRLVAAEKNLSMSRLVSGSVRVHPSVTAVGQAAGVVAARSVRLGVPPRQVPVAPVQLALAEAGALILPGVPPASPGSSDWAALSLALVRDEPVSMVDPRTRQIVIPGNREAELKAAGERLVAAARDRVR